MEKQLKLCSVLDHDTEFIYVQKKTKEKDQYRRKKEKRRFHCRKSKRASKNDHKKFEQRF